MNSTSPPTNPTPTPDQSAAHDFLCELRTRITTQHLPYQHGVEATALESLWKVFDQARAAMKKYPGCEKFADEVTQMLNVHLRPVTAKWHRAHEEGRLNSRDGADEFRGDLAAVQDGLRAFASRLHQMAYGTAFDDKPTPPALTDAELDGLFATNVPYGLAKGLLIPDQTVDDINSEEKKEVTNRRTKYSIGTPAGMNAVGLALSGGGIRSATFCLGVVQVLAERGLLKDVDFLSTVSGGGYTGSFLTTRLGAGQPHSDVANPHGPDPGPIRYLRQHAKYLSAVDLKQAWSMVTATLAGLLLNWSAPLFLIVVAALAAIASKDVYPGAAWMEWLAVLGGLTGVAMLAYCWLMRRGQTPARIGGKLFATLLAATLAVGALWLLDLGHGALPALRHTIEAHWKLSGIVAAVVAAGPAIIRFLPVLKNPAVRKIVLKVLLYVAGLVIPLGALALFYGLWYAGEGSSDATIVLVGIAAVSAFVAIFLLNINLTGPHRLYRDQLARTFVQADEEKDAPIALSGINSGNSGPYHLINTTVNLPSSTHEALRDRKSDFFLFSKHWCGSPSTGYHATTKWRTNGAPADLATAMAVSGAAASSYMGLGSMPTLTALMTFLNVRLGFWILRPDRTRLFKAPGFLCLIREMTGIAMSEKRAWLNLSDGGHIENMAVYELLRRRCKYIISVDGESDPEFTFQGHMTLVRHAQIDFGVSIDSRLKDLRPDAKTNYCQTHAMFCRIQYPAAGGQPAATGLLLYLKLSLTGNEPELLRRYKITHPDFPHQTTLDQFFDEEQFEAYRQLGVHVAEGLFSRALIGTTQPATVPDWFRRLGANLLEPKAT